MDKLVSSYEIYLIKKALSFIDSYNKRASQLYGVERITEYMDLRKKIEEMDRQNYFGGNR